MKVPVTQLFFGVRFINCCKHRISMMIVTVFFGICWLSQQTVGQSQLASEPQNTRQSRPIDDRSAHRSTTVRLALTQKEKKGALLDRLLKHYNKHIIPSNEGHPFPVQVMVDLKSIDEIDEIEEMLSSVISLSYTWEDDRIKWNKDEHNISYLANGWMDVWKPIFRVMNPHAESYNRQTVDRTYDFVIYTPDGEAYFDEVMVTRTTCDLDMTYYPFDVQTCDIELGIVGGSKFDFNLSIYDISSAQDEHGEWHLIHKNVLVKRDGVFQIQMKFERWSLFLLLHILLPIIVLAFLTPAVFLLPKKSGERVGFSVTILLAISVYMTIVSEHLPHNSKPIPLILILMFLWYIVDALIVFLVIINFKIYTMDENIPLSRLSHLFVHCTHAILRQKRKYDKSTASEVDANTCDEEENIDGTDNANTSAEMKDGHRKGCSNKDEDRHTWKELSHCIDKWCFAFSYVIKIAIPVVFFAVWKSTS